MHELSLAESLIDSLKEEAKIHEATRIVSISLQIGAMSGVEAEPMEFCFSEVARGTIAEGATLLIEKIPVMVLCEDCQEKTNPMSYFMRCGSCGSRKVKVVSGKEFKIVSLEVE